MTRPAPHVVLGVGGGIAAYKACELLRLFTESGHDVTAVPTANALRFVGRATFEALSGHAVATDVFEDVDEVRHVRLGRSADLVVIAPATADLLSRAATGRADDLLTATLLTARCPVVFAPAMHTEMWEHPATQANVALLRERGAIVIDPAVGRLTGTDSGAGRLPDPASIYGVASAALAHRGVADLSGLRVVVSAGGTREPLDPVRFLGNRSSGRQGLALAHTAVARGARVTVVAANVALPEAAGADTVRVGTTQELADAVLAAALGADAVVMAAAPADFRAAEPADHKMKKRPDGRVPALDLVETTDVLAALVAARHDSAHDLVHDSAPDLGQVLVGFAAETGDEAGSVLDHARAKLARKGCDLEVVNDVSGGAVFGSDATHALILRADGSSVEVLAGTKTGLAHAVWDEVLAFRAAVDGAGPGGRPVLG